MEYIGALFSSLLTLSPILLVWLVGIFMASARYGEHPSRYKLTIIGLIILLVNGFFSVFRQLMPLWLINAGWESTQVGVWLTVVAVVSSIFSAVGFGFVLAAIFKADKPK